MKILFVTGTLTHGGAQRVISVVSGKLAELGHDVSLIIYKKFENEYHTHERVKRFYLAENEEVYEKISGFRRVIMLRRLLRKIKPDVAVGFLEGGYGMFISSIGMCFKKIASARVNPKYIFEESGSRGFLNKLWFRRADAVVLQTQSQTKFLTKSCGWKNINIIPNPVSEAALRSPAHDYGRNVSRLVMAGRLNEQKDYPTAIDAMKTVHEKFPDIKLDIYGEGDIRPMLEKKIQDMGLENTVSLKGWTKDVVSEYEKSDLYIMSSAYEGMPNSLMEAMACGMVCISTDCETGPSDLIENGKNGFLIPAGDAASLARRIVDIAQMTKEQRKKLGTEAKKTIEESYSGTYVGKRWETLVKSLLRSEEK